MVSGKANVFDREQYHDTILKNIPQYLSVLYKTLGSNHGKILTKSGRQDQPTAFPITLLSSISGPKPEIQDPFLKIIETGMKEIAYNPRAASWYAILTLDLVLKGLKYLTAGSNPEELYRGMQLFHRQFEDQLGKLAKKKLTKTTFTQLVAHHLDNLNTDPILRENIRASIQNKDSFIHIEPFEGRQTVITKRDGYLLNGTFLNPENLKPSAFTNKQLFLHYFFSVSGTETEIFQGFQEDGLHLVLFPPGTLSEHFRTSLKNRTQKNIFIVELPDKEALEDVHVIFDLNKSTISATFFSKEIYCNSILDKGIILQPVSGLTLQTHLRKLKARQQESTHFSEWKKYQYRIANCSRTISILSVGAPTKTENRQKVQGYQEAMNQLQLIQHFGMVPSFGAGFFHAANASSVEVSNRTENSDLAKGAKIMKNALKNLIRPDIHNHSKNPEKFVSWMETDVDGDRVFDSKQMSCTPASDQMKYDAFYNYKKVAEKALETSIALLNTSNVVAKL